MLTIEDGSGVSGALSYVSLDTATSFFKIRGFEAPTEALLLQAMDFIESLEFYGTPTHQTQITAFPRSDIVNKHGIAYEENEIPIAVINAQLWLTYYIQNGFNPSAVATLAVRSEQVDVLQVEYFGDSGSNQSSKTNYGLSDLPNFFNWIKHLTPEANENNNGDGSGDSNGDVFANARVIRG